MTLWEMIKYHRTSLWIITLVFLLLLTARVVILFVRILINRLVLLPWGSKTWRFNGDTNRHNDDNVISQEEEMRPTLSSTPKSGSGGGGGSGANNQRKDSTTKRMARSDLKNATANLNFNNNSNQHQQQQNNEAEVLLNDLDGYLNYLKTIKKS